MRKTTMPRKTLTILSLIGLLLSVGLWGASYWGIKYAGGENLFELHNGGLRWQHLEGALFGNPGWRRVSEYATLHTDWLPTFDSYIVRHKGYRLTESFAPFWIPSAFFALLSSWLFVYPSHRRGKRKKLGLCVKCGYDLRGSTDRCPECGTAIASSGV